jgi:hypothetical protein
MGEMDHFIHNLTQVGLSKEEEEGGGKGEGEREGKGERAGKGGERGRGEIAAMRPCASPLFLA